MNGPCAMNVDRGHVRSGRSGEEIGNESRVCVGWGNALSERIGPEWANGSGRREETGSVRGAYPSDASSSPFCPSSPSLV